MVKCEAVTRRWRENGEGYRGKESEEIKINREERDRVKTESSKKKLDRKDCDSEVRVCILAS